MDLSETRALDELELDTDLLVNCAGIQRIDPIQDYDPDTWRLIHRIMFEAPFLLIRAVLPGIYERGVGRIIDVSSAHGLIASPFKSAYVAAKHGLEGLSETTALEGGPHGVTSNCINPGVVRTPLVEKQIADQARTRGIGEDEVLEQVLLADAASSAWWSPRRSEGWRCGWPAATPPWCPGRPTPLTAAGPRTDRTAAPAGTAVTPTLHVWAEPARNPSRRRTHESGQDRGFGLSGNPIRLIEALLEQGADEQSIVTDFALVHAARGDRHGNLVFTKATRQFSPPAAMAGKVCIAQVEELVEPGEIDPDEVYLPGLYVHRIVEVGTDIEKRTVRRSGEEQS